MKVGDLITNRHGQIRLVVDIYYQSSTVCGATARSTAVTVMDWDRGLQSYSQRYLEQFSWKVGDDTEELE